jgi:hypothetical protein
MMFTVGQNVEEMRLGQATNTKAIGLRDRGRL